MKHLILAAAALTLFASCKKCYKCTTTLTGKSGSYHKEIIREYDFCTTKKSDVYNEERKGTVSTNWGSEQTTSCKR